MSDDYMDDWPDEWPDPEEVADDIADFASGDGAGLYHDILVEASNQSAHYAESMTSIRVCLDAIVDDREYVPDPVVGEVTAMMKTATTINRYLSAIETETRRKLNEMDD
jgi:hypothetical protein